VASMIVRYEVQGLLRWGVLTSPAPTNPDDAIEVIEVPTEVVTTSALLATLESDPLSVNRGIRVPLIARDLLSPITANSTLLCQGLNYWAHAAEAGHRERKQNLLFAKASSSLSGPYDDIVRPAGVELLDYEVEVGIVLRKDLTAGTVVDDDNIGSYVAGVVLCNDVSARDVMFGATFLQWFQGKSYRTFCPTGPVLYLLDEPEVAKTVANLEISLTYKEAVRQSANTSQLIYKPAETLTHVATIMDLRRGDVILTGTPGGVILRAPRSSSKS
jgi:2-keto-4-pentenoate hydratase/2-oxohepta-3-ene-1,7-dioic acid hydratase in catechol pathway